MYTTIHSSLDMTKIYTLMNRCAIGLFMTTCALFGVHLLLESNGIIIQDVHLWLYSSLILLNVLTVASILRYGKREIVTLTSAPKTKRTFTVIIRALGKHILDLILVPAITLYVIFDAYSRISSTIDYYFVATVSFTLLTITSVAPLRYQKDKYARTAHLRISDSVRTITISRNMLEGLDRRTKKYKDYLDHIMHAEEIIRCDSDFLMLSGGKFIMLISGLRFLTPAIPTIIKLVVP
jgi:hypothetical protein